MTQTELGIELQEPQQQITEEVIEGRDGFAMLALWLLVLVVPGVGAVVAAGLILAGSGSVALAVSLLVIGAIVVLVALVGLCGLKAVAPGEARVIQLFGRYRGTIREQGFRWVNPFTASTAVSTRVRNHETELAKVNDASGSPIQIAAVVVWQVVDTARHLRGRRLR